ncbi:anti-anti-sigma factor [Persicitalea sp.]|uniref:anti-anti-sigma factor n=1 Tax=Persicitalea sp. TaxID=3100273 RepID=UPI0035948210
MDYKIDRKEQFAVITLKEAQFDEAVAEEFEEVARDLLSEDYSNLIVVMDQTQGIENSGVMTLRKLVRLCTTKLGILVAATENDDFAEVLEDSKIADLLVLPTLEEAIDAVFMHDLENEFGAGDDDDDYDDDDYQGISELKEP